MEKLKGICLTMIVKDESRVIERCLESVKPYIDSWAITDTGSTDNTVEIIERVMEGVDGKVYHEPWVNFGHNRNVAFENAKKHGRYALIIDADDVIETEKSFSWPENRLSHYEITVELCGNTFVQARLLDTEKKWKWEGAVHEYPHLKEGADVPEKIENIIISSKPDGNRRLMNEKEKYKNDAIMIEKELEKNPKDTRSVFYLAQSYRDCGELRKSIDAYRRRIDLGGWAEEVWYSQYQIGSIYERMSEEEGGEKAKSDLWDMASSAYTRAYDLRPSRSEPLYRMGRKLRLEGRYHLALVYLTIAKDIKIPNDRLFMNRSIYEWRSLDEYAICCYWTQRDEEALLANIRLLEVAPASQFERIVSNMNFSISRSRNSRQNP